MSFANQASWDCRQKKGSQEWVCVGEKKTSPENDESVEANKHESVDEAVIPVPAKDTKKSTSADRSYTPPVTETENTQQIQQNDVLTPDTLKSLQHNSPDISAAQQPVIPTPPVAKTPMPALPPALRVAKPVAPTPPVAKTPMPALPPALNVAKPIVPKPPVATQTPKPDVPPEPLVETFIPKQLLDTQTPEPVQPSSPTEATTTASEGNETGIPVSSTNEVEETGKPLASTNKQSSAPDTYSNDLRRSGWNCGSSSQDENWNCQLVGADPGLMEQEENKSETGFRIMPLTFDRQQEQAFRNLTAQLKYDPWKKCNTLRGTQQSYIPQKDFRPSAPVDVTSDYSEIFDNEIGSYTGNVIVTRADQHSISNTANYDKVSQMLDLQGDIYYTEDELALHSRSASLNLASDEARLRDSLFISPAAPLRGGAKVIFRDSKTLSRYKEVAFTSCRPGNQDWVLHASELKMNTVVGRAAAKNAWMEFKGVPVMWLPYVSFPTDNRRVSGFLAPSWGMTQKSGFQFGAPYYWNIAPNYDATLRPRYYAKRGAILGVNFRYLEKQTNGYANVEYMPHDNVLGKARYLGSFTNHTAFTPHIGSNIDLNYASDKTYFSDLGNALSIPNFNYLRSTADVNYIRPGVAFTTSAISYQSVNPLITDDLLPYQKLPQVNFNLNHSFRLAPTMPLETLWGNEMVNFSHKSLVDGQRYNTMPSIALPLQTAGAFVKPKVTLQYTQYILNRQPTNYPSEISRVLPIVSLDSGLFFDGDVKLGNTPFQHTLEPRLFYLYIPRKNQSNIPLFDTAQYDFVYNSLFRENRFSGIDRIQDANQLSVAFTSRLIDSTTGLERLKLNLGNILYFENREVVLNGPSVIQSQFPVETSFNSPLVAELSSQIVKKLSVDTMLQWDPATNTMVRGKAFMHYVDESKKIFNAGYYYRNNPNVPDRSNDIIYTDVSMRWPIYDNWSAVGRWQYSLLYDRTQEGFFGLEKENCCWRFSILGRHYINSIVNNYNVVGIGTNTQVLAQGQAQNTVFFQIEFKGVGSFDSGADLDKFLERNINGYQVSRQ
jgi:LPS-assembly protein